MDPTTCFQLVNQPTFDNQNLQMEQLSPPIPAAKPRRVRRVRKCEDGQQTGQRIRSSIYKGVTKHRWTGRYEAHLWDKHGWSPRQNKKGRQVYLGAYDDEETAAHTYDLAALKYWGVNCVLNFPVSTYVEEYVRMQSVPRDMYIASLRRKSSGFSRGESKYRGVAKHHKNGRWEARIGRVYNNKYLYLGTFDTQEEAAIAYDRAVIHYRGANAVTNFDMSQYSKPSEREINHCQIYPFLLENLPSENMAVELENVKLNQPAVNQPILPDLTEIISDIPGTDMSRVFEEFSHEHLDSFSCSSEGDGLFSGMQEIISDAAPVDSTIAPPLHDDFFKYMDEVEAGLQGLATYPHFDLSPPLYAAAVESLHNEALWPFGSCYPFHST